MSPRNSRTVLALCMLGIAIRVSQVMLQRSLYIDEAMLALGIGASSWRDLAGPLLYDQLAPFGFVLLGKSGMVLGNGSELLLRAPSIAAGLLALPVGAALAYRVARSAAPFVLTVMALAPGAVHYSNDFKPYAFDLMFGAAIPWLALRYCENRGERSRLLHITMCCALAPLLGVGATIIALGTFAILLLADIKSSGVDGFHKRELVLATGVVGLACTAGFLLSYQAVPAGGYIETFWQNAYIDISSLEGLARTGRLAMRGVWLILAGPALSSRGYELPLAVVLSVEGILTTVVLALTVIGVRHVYGQSGWVHTGLLFFPLLLLLAASAGHLLPLSGRMWLGAFVPGLILAGSGLARVLSRLGRDRQWAGLLCGLALVGWGLPADGRWRTMDVQWTDAREIVQTAEAVGGPVYVSARAIPQWLYYSIDWSMPDLASIRLVHSVSRYGAIAFENVAEPREPTAFEQRVLGVFRARDVVLGLPSGMAFTSAHGWNRIGALPGWAESETKRILTLEGRSVLMMFMHNVDGTPSELLEALERGGMKCTPLVRSFRGGLEECVESSTQRPP